jgi:glycosyltransferase involved in cell wall biosynthesis
MKIGINGRFLSAPRITGVERVAHEVVGALLQQGEDEYVIYVDRGAQAPPAGATTVAVRMGRRRWQRHLWEQVLLPGHARQVDLLFNPCNTAPLLVENQVVVIYDTTFLPEYGWHRAAFSAYYGWLLPRLVRRVRGVITGSEYTKREIVARLGAPAERVRVIPNGVSPMFRPVDRAAARVRHGLPSDYFLFVGSLEPRKNLVTLLQAVRTLRERRMLGETKLVIVGCQGGNFKDAGLADDLAALQEAVLALGYVPDADLAGVYSGARALVFPSLYEGFGLPALEAMACGTPVVASNTTALPEVVGAAGLLVEPTDPLALADAMAKLCDNTSLRAQLSAAGLAQAARFDWETTARRTRAFLKELAV